MMNLGRILTSCAALGLVLGTTACGGGSGGGDGGGDTTMLTTIEGTLRTAASASRVLGPGEGGIAGVTVGALGDSAVTDENGNFNLSVDGAIFSGGTVEFTFSSETIAETAILEGVPGGPGTMAFTDFFLEDSGRITGESLDANGEVIGTTPGGRLGCSVTQTFVDGGLGALWKPHSERTGTVVILMPAEYRNADVVVYNNSGDVVDGPLIRDCCSHNGGREHVYLTRSSGDLAGAGVPLTVQFTFSDGFSDCRTVPDPNQRYD